MADLSKLPAMPNPATVPVVGANGMMNRDWAQYFAALDRLLRQVRTTVEPL